MKHATEGALVKMAGVLARLRKLPGMRERKVGVFYRKGRAFVHFHEDAAGMFADVHTRKGWRRLAVNGAGEVKGLLHLVQKEIGEER